MAKKEKVYPYLGQGSIGGKGFVVWFTEAGKGIVVQTDNPDNEMCALGKYGEFDENWFELLPDGMCVRIENHFDKEEGNGIQ